MVASHLMDSNVLIDYASGKFSGAAGLKLDGIFNESFHYSILSRMEVLGYNAPIEVLQNMEEFLSTGIMIYVTDEICNRTISVRRSLPKIKLPDAIIAATAIVHSLTLLTRNTSDFKNVIGLSLIDPWEE